jgi:hypothetical protein
LSAGENGEWAFPGKRSKKARPDHQPFISHAPIEMFPQVNALEDALDPAVSGVMSATADKRMSEFPIVVVTALVLERLDLPLRWCLPGEDARYFSNRSTVRLPNVHQHAVQVKDNQ